MNVDNTTRTYSFHVVVETLHPYLPYLLSPTLVDSPEPRASLFQLKCKLWTLDVHYLPSAADGSDPHLPTSTVPLHLSTACEGFPVTSASRCFISFVVQAAPTRVVITLGVFPPAVAHKTRRFVTLTWCGTRFYRHFTHEWDVRGVKRKGPALAAPQRASQVTARMLFSTLSWQGPVKRGKALCKYWFGYCDKLY